MTFEKDAKVNAKGGVVIPAELRKKRNIQPGDKMVWIEKDGELVLRRLKSHSYESERI